MCDMKMEQKDATGLYTDNQGAIAIAHNPAFMGEQCDLMLSYFSIETCINMEMQKLLYCKSDEQVAEIFTKHPLAKFNFFRKKLTICRF